MASVNYGMAGLNSSLNPSVSNTNRGKSGASMDAARVISVVLDDTHPRFNELGGWNALGAIEYNIASNPSYKANSYPVAYPLNANIKNFPLVNEIVLIQSSFSTGAELFEDNIDIKSGTALKKYYSSNISVWNHPHHNGYSFNIKGKSSTQNKSYLEAELGNVNKVDNTPIGINLGNTFVEKENIHPLLPFEGDIIYEGRWGNSIRFGSTIKNKFLPSSPLGLNNWSNGSTNLGDPITIIRNGQGNRDNTGFIPITEDINIDDSSIYLTSTQKIPLRASSTKYYSYTKSNPQPISPNNYSEAQIILSSNRLLFNTYSDHILLASAKSINLNALNSVNIDSPTLSIKTNNIYLGENSDFSKNEPLMLGNQTAKLLKALVKSLSTFMQIASTATTNVCVPGSPTTLPTLNSAAQDVLDDLYNLNKELGSDENLKDCNLTSKRNYTV